MAMGKSGAYQEKDPNALLQLPEGRQVSLGSWSRDDVLCAWPGRSVIIPDLVSGQASRGRVAFSGHLHHWEAFAVPILRLSSGYPICCAIWDAGLLVPSVGKPQADLDVLVTAGSTPDCL